MGGHNKRMGRKNFQNLINGGGGVGWGKGVKINGGCPKLKKWLKVLIKPWKDQKQVTIYT